MTNDRKIMISTGASRRSTAWQPTEMSLSELYQRLQNPLRGTETLAEYLAMRKADQDTRKDVGGFVGGELEGRRKKANVKGRDLLTLDLDNLLFRSGRRVFPVFNEEAQPGSAAAAHRCRLRSDDAAGGV